MSAEKPTVFHAGYFGATQTGKTTLARHIARGLAARGHRIVVFDPVMTATYGGGWPESAEIFDDYDRLAKNLGSGPAHVFVDEAGEVFGVSEKDRHWIATRGRHYGFSLHLIAQRPKQVAPNVRGQLARAYLFRLAVDDAREISADLGHNLPTLPQEAGGYIMLRSDSSTIAVGNVFNPRYRAFSGDPKS
jgi:DNA helicase HerA-like ATPase